MACMGVNGTFRPIPTISMKAMVCIPHSTYTLQMMIDRLKVTYTWKESNAKIGTGKLSTGLSFKHNNTD